MKTFNVVIADDHPIVLLGVRELVERDTRFQVVGEAVCSAGLIELLQRQGADIEITIQPHPSMPTARLLSAASPRSPITPEGR